MTCPLHLRGNRIEGTERHMSALPEQLFLLAEKYSVQVSTVVNL